MHGVRARTGRFHWRGQLGAVAAELLRAVESLIGAAQDDLRIVALCIRAHSDTETDGNTYLAGVSRYRFRFHHAANSFREREGARTAASVFDARIRNSSPP